MKDTCQTISLEEAGKILGVGKDSIYKAAHAGDIPTIKIGRLFRVPVAALEKMLNGEK